MKKSVKKKIDLPNDITSYIMGILSIVMAFFQPGAGVVLGIIGLVKSKKDSNDLSERGKKLSIIGLILSIIFLTMAIGFAIYSTRIIQTFPAA